MCEGWRKGLGCVSTRHRRKDDEVRVRSYVNYALHSLRYDSREGYPCNLSVGPGFVIHCFSLERHVTNGLRAALSIKRFASLRSTAFRFHHQNILLARQKKHVSVVRMATEKRAALEELTARRSKVRVLDLQPFSLAEGMLTASIAKQAQCCCIYDHT